MTMRKAALPTLIACTLLLAACGQAAPKPPVQSQLPKALAVRPPAQTPELAQVTMLSPTVSVAGGLGVILRSANDGRTWTAVAYPAGTVTSFDRVSGSLVFAVTSRGLYKSANGGQAWQAVNLTSRLYQVDFLTPQRGFAVPAGIYGNASGKLLETIDGGAVWSPASASLTATSLCFTSATDGVALGMPPSSANGANAPGSSYVTSNGGRSWQRLSNLPGNWEAGQVYCGASGVWLELYGMGGMSQGPYTIFHSTNAGQTWQAVAADVTADGPDPGSPLHVAQAPGSSPGPATVAGADGFAALGSCEACGFGGTVFFGATHDGGQTFTASSTPMPELTDISLTGISFISATDGMIVSHPGPGLSVVLTTQDGGQSWQTAARLVSPNPVGGISFVSSQVGFGRGTATDPLAVLKTTDGGHSWHKVGNLPGSAQSAFTLAEPFAFAFVSATDGFAVVGSGQMVETTDGGRTWQPVTAFSGLDQVAALAFTSPTDGCTSLFTPSAAVLWATTDGGAHWTELGLGSKVSTFAMGFGFPMVACAAALANPALESGLPPLPSGSEGMMVAAPGGREALVLTYTSPATAPNGALLTAAPGQAAWSVHSLPPGQFNPYAFSFVSGSQGYLTTNQGRLFETTTGGASWVELP